MKKILMSAMMMMGLVSFTFAQTAPAKEAKKAAVKTTVASKKSVKETTEATPAVKVSTKKTTDVKEAAAQVSTSASKMKKDGTPDKRFKSNAKMKKDGTIDKRYKENKKG